MTDLALQLIAREKKEKTGKLDLGKCGLTELPEELFELVWLEELSLGDSRWDAEYFNLIVSPNNGSYNRLQENLPDNFKKLKQLKRLYLSRIYGVGSPPNNSRKYDISILSHLTGLQSLDISSNDEKIKDYNFIENLTALQSLNLSSNKIYGYSFLEKLIALQHLILSSNEITNINPIKKLTGLQTLDLADNSISDLSPLVNLTRLQSLYLSVNRFSDISILEKFTELRALGLNDTFLSDYSVISKLTGLQSLWIGSNYISDISFLEKLTGLQSLNLHGNEIREYKFLNNLTNLQSLDLSYNRITGRIILKNLTNLQSLSLSHNQITDIQLTENLTGLETLSLNKNQFKNISFIENLVGLQRLDLSFNQIREISSLKKLKDLQFLNLANNQIIDVDSISGLINLHNLNLNNNQITDIRPLLHLIENGIPVNGRREHNTKWIDAHRNPLSTPPIEIVREGNEAILNYFRQIDEQGGTEFLYEAKVLIVGEPGAGKTSLANKIINPEYQLKKDEKSTEGIDVLRWGFDLTPHNEDQPVKFRANIWDFGGQEIYHATHQFFLTKRSLYVLVADSRKEDTDFNYWLHIVELLSDNSPLFIVLNEKQNRERKINVAGMKGRFANLIDHIKINLADNRGLDALIAEVKHQICKLPLVGTELPKSWVEIREVLENDGRDYVSQEEYLRLCKENGIEDYQKALFLSDYYHDLGVFLHFQDDAVLKHTIILKPQWGTAAVYRVLDDQAVKNNSGRFTKADLKNIWHEEKYALKQDALLQLMIKFQLCYQVENQDLYIAPELLEINQPAYDWNDDNNIILRFKYEFMPKGIMTQFIVRMPDKIKNQDWVWKEGVILEWNHTWAEVIETYGKHEIKIRVEGANKKAFMTIIIEEFERIHRTYQQLKYEKLIPCNCTKCKNQQRPHFYKYDNLLDRSYKRIQKVQCDISYEEVYVRALIDDVVDVDLLEKKFKFDELNIISFSKDEIFELMRSNSYSPVYVENKHDINYSPQLNVQVNVNVINENVTNLSDTLDLVKDEMLDALEDTKERKNLEKEIERVEKALKEVKGISSKEKAKEKSGSLKKIKNFLDKLEDTSTKAGKAFKAVEKGYSHLQDLAKHYNNIAEWCALPQVPKLLLKKK